jgi:RNA polymerase sigma-70 factor (ECF subfamily)
MDVPREPHASRLLQESMQGSARSTAQLVTLTYDDLRRQAHRMLGKADNTLDATALVHETFLRLIDQRQQDWRSRSHFAAISSTVLRRVLVDALRARGRQRDRQTRLSGFDEADGSPMDAVDVLDLDEALAAFAEVDAQAARIVELRFFGGLTVREIAEELRAPRSTVQDAWTFARAWLGRRLADAR